MKIELKGLGFSAAHLVVGHTKCEHFHGHNWKVGIMLEGKPDERGLVLDFIELKEVMEKLCDSYDHRILMPDKNKALKRKGIGKNVRIEIHGREFEFPSEDVVWVPVVNITVEELARVIADLAAESLRKYPNLEKITVTVDETEGEGAKEERLMRGKTK